MGGMYKTSPLIEHTIPSNYTSNQSGPIINATCSGPQASPHNFNFSVVGWVLSIPVFTYAQMLHPGTPSLTHPIKQKKGLHWFMAAIFGTTLFCYMTLGIVVSLWFRGDINETASLNWVPLTKPGHYVALRALSYIIILFPTLDVISAYPLVTCSMVNNLYQVIMGRDTSQRKHSYDGLILVAMRAVVAILPIVCSLFISNLVYILKYGGLVGFLTAFFFPLALQLASQYKCVKSKWFKIIFLVVITLSSFLALWSFSTVGGSGWSTNLRFNIGPFRICSDAEFHDTLVPANPGCLASYRFCLFLLDVYNPVPLMSGTEGARLHTGHLGHRTLHHHRVHHILYCLVKLAESPLIEHTIPSNSTSNQSGPVVNATCSGPQTSSRNFVLDFSVVGWVLSIPVFTYAQMLHPGIPSLTHPIKQKKGLHWFMAAIFGTTLFCYMTLGIVMSLWFRGDINETASLNWVPLTKPGHHVALRALSYIIILFPTLDVISAYPLVTCSMVNNLYQVIMGRDTSQRKHSYDGLILVAMRAVVAILPIVCSLFISNLVYILKYGGLVGFLTAFFFPLALQLASQYKCVKVFGKELAPAAAARGTPLQPHVDTKMEVLKKDGEEEGAELTEGNEDELGRENAGIREGLLLPWPRQSRCI
eukprot:Em0003g822a